MQKFENVIKTVLSTFYVSNVSKSMKRVSFQWIFIVDIIVQQVFQQILYF